LKLKKSNGSLHQVEWCVVQQILIGCHGFRGGSSLLE
jgi:hypothetical protein